MAKEPKTIEMQIVLLFFPIAVKNDGNLFDADVVAVLIDEACAAAVNVDDCARDCAVTHDNDEDESEGDSSPSPCQSCGEADRIWQTAPHTNCSA